jgi:PKD repeat protein
MPLVLAVLAAALLMGGGFTPDPEVAAYAHFTCSPESGPSPLEVAFLATASSDPDEDIRTFVWSFGDGSIGSGTSVVHTFVDPGSYDVGLATVNSKGAIGTFSRTVHVSISELLGIGDVGRIIQAVESSPETGQDASSIIEFASWTSAFEETNEEGPEAAPLSDGDAWTIEVTLRDARLLHALGSFRVPEFGYIYVLVEVGVASRDQLLSVAPADFQLVDAEGRVTRPDLCIRCLHRPLKPTVLGAGEQAEGQVLFETRRSSHYTLEYGATLGYRIRFRFSL